MKDDKDDLEYRKGAADMLGCVVVIWAVVMLIFIVAKSFGWL